MPTLPQSEVQARFWQLTGGKMRRRFGSMFLRFQGTWWQEMSPTYPHSIVHEQNSFSIETGSWRTQDDLQSQLHGVIHPRLLEWMVPSFCEAALCEPPPPNEGLMDRCGYQNTLYYGIREALVLTSIQHASLLNTHRCTGLLLAFNQRPISTSHDHSLLYYCGPSCDHLAVS